MFLGSKIRRKDGKEHRTWSVVENRRVGGGRVVQRHVLYLGEINSTQELGWRRSIEVMEAGTAQPRTLSLFPEDRCEGLLPDASIVRLKLSQVRLRRPRQWGACWLALELWRGLGLDRFWADRLGPSGKGTHWDQVLFVLVAYRRLAPGSEWRLHREWFERSALADLLGEDAGLAESPKLYRCHDRLLEHKQAVFEPLIGRWRDPFNISFDVLLYDLTSTYFESDPPFAEGDKRRHGYSRDHRSDRVQVIIALVVTPEGLPLAYEVLPGNTADNTTLKAIAIEVARGQRRAQLSPRSRQAAASSAARGPVSTAHQSHRRQSGAAVGLVPPARQRRAGVPQPQRRPRHPADLPPGRGAHRGADLHRLPRLLPPRHARPAPPRPGARLDAAPRHRKVRRRADDRSACPDDRRPRAAADPLHRAAARARAAARQTQIRPPRPAETQNHCPAKYPAIVPTFAGRTTKKQALGTSRPRQSAKLG